MIENKSLWNKINEAIDREFGEGAKLEEGETWVFQLNDCIMVMTNEDDTMKMEFVGGKPILVDATTGFYEEEVTE